MMTIRAAHERGHANHGWLDTYHTFSFADYYDPQEMGFSVLRVINEDRVQPGMGFGTHSHQNMEIISVVLEGALEHRDSMGNHSVIRPGEVQRMSAGTGVTHSEFNPSQEEEAHFLQIWVKPERQGIAPSYEQREFPASARLGRLALLASPDGRDGSLALHQDIRLYATSLLAGQSVSVPLPPGRRAYLHMVRGEMRVNGQSLRAGDGVRAEQEPSLTLETPTTGEALLFDLP